VCPFATHQEPAAYRIPIDLPAGDALHRPWLMVGKLMAIQRERVGSQITALSAEQIAAVSQAMVDLLGLDPRDQ